MREILVVDDGPVVSKSINRALASKGYAVSAAAPFVGFALFGWFRAKALLQR